MSDMAYESVKESNVSLRSKIFHALASKPSTDDELEVLLRRRHQSVSSVRRHLVKDELIESSDEIRKTRSGRYAQVWRLTPRGEEIWKEMQK
jgi:predicted ArsR family transcriptional regulator